MNEKTENKTLKFANELLKARIECVSRELYEEITNLKDEIHQKDELIKKLKKGV